MELKDFEVTIGNYTFAHPIMNAAGYCKKQREFEELLRSVSSGIVVGSVLPEEKTRLGNEGQVYVPGRINDGPLAPRNEPFALNSLGIPCQSISYYQEHLPIWVQQAKEAEKHLVFNIAGLKISDYVELARLALSCGVYILEVNFGCPNLSDSGKHKPTISYDPNLMSLILGNLKHVLQGTAVDIWVKVSWDNATAIKRNAKIFANFPMVKAVVTLNTLENCCDYDSGHLVITPNNGFAGMSGPALRAPSLGQIRKWREALDELDRSDIKIIGVGGSSTPEHIWEKELAGAAACQVGTAFFDYCESHPNTGGDFFGIMFADYVELREAFDPEIKFIRESPNF